MLKAIIFLTVLSIAPAYSEETLPADTVTISKELAEKLTQLRVDQQTQIEQLRYEIYQYQMLLHEARTKMCA